MMQYLSDNHIATFFLLLLRFGSLVVFMPFYDNNIFPINLKLALSFFVTLLFFPLALPYMHIQSTFLDFIIAGFLEISIGFLVAFALQIVFNVIGFAGENMSFTMGLSMASAYDPSTGNVKPIVAQVLTLLAVLIALELDFHHFLFILVGKSLSTTPLGEVVISNNILKYLILEFSNLFVIGFTMAFPVVAIILMSDIVFGMIMKTHQQFNLLSIGFPVKIVLAFFVLILIVPAIIYHFRGFLLSVMGAVLKIF